MLRIVGIPVKAPKSTDLNSIPVGQVFKGTIMPGHDSESVTGLFIKLYHGNWQNISRNGTRSGDFRDVIVVRLDIDRTVAQQKCLWTFCQRVDNYEPVEAVLTLSEG